MRSPVQESLSFPLLILVALAATVAMPPEAFAQGETTSAIVGEVKDTSQALVAGATVSITNRETGLKRSVKTDAAGRFSFPQLMPGFYSVQVEAPGFFQERVDRVFAGLGQKQIVSFVLKPASASTTIEVGSEAPLLNPENANT